MFPTIFRRTLLMPSIALVSLTTAPITLFAAQDMPSPEEMWKIIQLQQQQILELQQKVNATEVKVVATADAVEQNIASNSSSSMSQWVEKTSFGGYGEMHYNSLENQLDGGKADKDELDLHRFVLYFGHQFSDDLRFYSELEVEHGISGDDQPGEDDHCRESSPGLAAARAGRRPGSSRWNRPVPGARPTRPESPRPGTPCSPGAAP